MIDISTPSTVTDSTLTRLETVTLQVGAFHLVQCFFNGLDIWSQLEQKLWIV